MSPASPTLRVAALEPYAAVSHLQFLEGLAARSRHRIEVHALPARAWKWRMRTAALHYAERLAAGPAPDLLLASDYVNLAELRALLPAALRDVPAVLYFHENQLTYPLQPGEARDHHYALTHLYAMLDARASRFNSAWHRESFLAALAELLGHVPDVDTGPALAAARESSGVLPLGTGLEAGEPRSATGEPPAILWNHRWEYDKDPDCLRRRAGRAEGPRARLPRARAGPDLPRAPAGLRAARGGARRPPRRAGLDRGPRGLPRRAARRARRRLDHAPRVLRGKPAFITSSRA